MVPFLHIINFIAIFSGICIVCKGKQSPNSGVDQPVDIEKYPSETLTYYLPYYLKYFTSSGFNYAKTQQQSDRTANICENHEDYFKNGTVIGVLPCPMEQDLDDFKYCCGDTNFQYCCKLIDKPGFLVMVILVSLTLIAILIIVIIFVICLIKSKKGKKDRKIEDEKQMEEMGIPRYRERNTSNFLARQTDDGYQIRIIFKSKAFYRSLQSELASTYPDLAWKKHPHSKGMREAKLTFADGGWVGLVMADDMAGKPEMIVVREKAAIDWMEKDFEDMCENIGHHSGGCLCFGSTSSKNQTHPVKRRSISNGNQRAQQYGDGNQTEEGSTCGDENYGSKVEMTENSDRTD